MTKRKNFQYGIPGGRAYYRGEDAYAAQSYENEARVKAADTTETLAAVSFSGIIAPFAGTTVPTGWLQCDGSLISRSTYRNLFDNIGTTWGTGDGSTTFQLPDFQGRALIGAGTGSGLSARTVGTSVGAETHTQTTPAHQHQTDMGWDSAGPAAYFRSDGSGNPLSGSIVESSVNGAIVTIGAPGSRNVRLALTRTDGGSTTGAGDSMQPSAVIMWIIKT